MRKTNHTRNYSMQSKPHNQKYWSEQSDYQLDKHIHNLGKSDYTNKKLISFRMTGLLGWRRRRNQQEQTGFSQTKEYWVQPPILDFDELGNKIYYDYEVMHYS